MLAESKLMLGPGCLAQSGTNVHVLPFNKWSAIITNVAMSLLEIHCYVQDAMEVKKFEAELAAGDHASVSALTVA